MSCARNVVTLIIHPTYTRPADAERAEVLGTPPLDFGCTIMVLGLSGTGKTATIHSLLGREQPQGYQETGKVRCAALRCAAVVLAGGLL